MARRRYPTFSGKSGCGWGMKVPTDTRAPRKTPEVQHTRGVIDVHPAPGPADFSARAQPILAPKCPAVIPAERHILPLSFHPLVPGPPLRLVGSPSWPGKTGLPSWPPRACPALTGVFHHSYNSRPACPHPALRKPQHADMLRGGSCAESPPPHPLDFGWA